MVLSARASTRTTKAHLIQVYPVLQRQHMQPSSVIHSGGPCLILRKPPSFSSHVINLMVDSPIFRRRRSPMWTQYTSISVRWLKLVTCKNPGLGACHGPREELFMHQLEVVSLPGYQPGKSQKNLFVVIQEGDVSDQVKRLSICENTPAFPGIRILHG